MHCHRLFISVPPNRQQQLLLPLQTASVMVESKCSRRCMLLLPLLLHGVVGVESKSRPEGDGGVVVDGGWEVFSLLNNNVNSAEPEHVEKSIEDDSNPLPPHSSMLMSVVGERRLEVVAVHDFVVEHPVGDDKRTLR